MHESYVATNGLQLCLLDHGGPGPTLLLLPGLTANRHTFDGLIAAGLNHHFHVLSVDMRGRGNSDKPENYAIAAHAADIVGLLDALGLERIVLGGHSFGGLMTMYLGALIPQRITKLVLIDSAISLATERTRELIAPALARLNTTYPSWDAYLTLMKQAPYFYGWPWDTLVESYYRADVATNADGTVQPHSRSEHIEACMRAVIAEPWQAIIAKVAHPVLLLHTPGAYGPPGAPPIVSEEQAEEMADLLQDCRYVEVAGNHMTMLYNEGAEHIVRAIVGFAAEV